MSRSTERELNRDLVLRAHTDSDKVNNARWGCAMDTGKTPATFLWVGDRHTQSRLWRGAQRGAISLVVHAGLRSIAAPHAHRPLSPRVYHVYLPFRLYTLRGSSITLTIALRANGIAKHYQMLVLGRNCAVLWSTQTPIDYCLLLQRVIGADDYCCRPIITRNHCLSHHLSLEMFIGVIKCHQKLLFVIIIITFVPILGITKKTCSDFRSRVPRECK